MALYSADTLNECMGVGSRRFYCKKSRKWREIGEQSSVLLPNHRGLKLTKRPRVGRFGVGAFLPPLVSGTVSWKVHQPLPSTCSLGLMSSGFACETGRISGLPPEGRAVDLSIPWRGLSCRFPHTHFNSYEG